MVHGAEASHEVGSDVDYSRSAAFGWSTDLRRRTDLEIATVGLDAIADRAAVGQRSRLSGV
jgi:hypothetical protein